MENSNSKIIRVGSRKSELALIQTNHVIGCLKKVYPDKEFKIVSMTTLGDRILNISLPKIGEKALFTKDLEDALRNDSVDFVVHSLKDLPTVLPDGLAIGAVLEREDPRDALVLREQYKGNTLATLPEGSLIGTSSLRRTAQINASYPHLRVADVRGNLNTRLRKLDEPTEHYAALLLAKAGLQRMGWENRCDYVLPCSEMLYAVGQGAIAIECRSDNLPILEMLSPLNHSATYCRVLAERSCLKTLGGGCSAPVGISTTLKQDDNKYSLSILSAVWSLDGKQKVSSKSVAHFASLTRTIKHRLSPTDENDCKKVKIDADKDLAKSEKTTSEQKQTEQPNQKQPNEVFIYCGMTENFNIPIEVIEQCEYMGIELANDMIQNGALEVMKLTQDMIRSSIGATNEVVA